MMKTRNEQAHLLLVDDDPDLLTLISMRLTAAGLSRDGGR